MKFWNLNKKCPKDDFPLHILKIMIEIASSYDIVSFKDIFLGYNLIIMAPKDKKFTTFRTPLGIYYYQVMPFGLEYAGITYQWDMTKIFNEHIHHHVLYYVNDLIVKS